MNTELVACTPAQAFKEYVEHPAVGSLTVVVANPGYVPAVDGYEVVKDKLIKWVWTGGPVEGAPVSPVEDATGWHLVGETNDKKGRDNPDAVLDASKGPGNSDWFFYQTQVTWVEGTPAVGEPTVEVANPAYVPAWTEVVVHEGVWCPVEETELPLVPVVPVEEPVATVVVVPYSSGDQLAVTGPADFTGVALAAVVLVVLGAGLLRRVVRS